MIYENKLRTKKVKTITATYNYFNKNSNVDFVDEYKNFADTQICYNFSVSKNCLETGYGFNKVILPIENGSEVTRIVGNTNKTINNLWLYCYYNNATNQDIYSVMWDNSDGNIEFFNIFHASTLSSEIHLMTPLTESPSGINYSCDNTDYMLFSAENGLYKLTYQSLARHNTELPKFVDLCYGYESLFGIVEGKRNFIFYSTTLDPINWTINENVIDLTDERGKCNSLLFYNDYVYVFRDYGITKISKYSSHNDFSVVNMFISASKIYGKTVVKCDDDVYFLAQDGIYIFNGASTHKIKTTINNLFKFVDNSKAVACYHNGKYFVACKLKFEDGENIGCENYVNGYVNNALIIYDIHTENLSIMRGVDIHSLLSVDRGNVSTVFASFYNAYQRKIGMINNNGEYFNTPITAVWSSVVSNFDCPEKIKNVKEVIIKSKQNCVMTIVTDLESKNINIVGSNKIQKIKTFVKGHTVQIKIKSTTTSCVYPFKLKLEIVEDELKK